MTARRIIDGDGHIIEDEIALSGFIPEPFRSAGPFQGFRLFPPLDHLHSQGPTTSPPGAFRPANAEDWGDFLDDVGIERTVLYPTFGLAYGKIHNRDWSQAVTRGYNDWLYSTYLKRDSRLHGMALLPLANVDAAILELRRVVDQLGMRGAMLPSNGLPQQLGAKIYWPLYAEAEKLGCALAVHGGCHDNTGLDNADPFAVTRGLGHAFTVAASFGGMIFAGIFDRFPNLRVAYLEAGAAWLLMAIERLEEGYETHIPYDPDGSYLQMQAGEDVADYIQRQIAEDRIFIGTEGKEKFLPQTIAALGSKGFVYSSDFPHETNPELCKADIIDINRNPGYSETDLNNIFADNAVRLYGF